MSLRQVVQQHVARTHVEAALAYRHVGDAAEVQTQVVVVEQVALPARHEWRPLPAQGDVLVPEVDHQRARQVRCHGFAVADLECEALLWLVEDRVSVRGYEVHFQVSFVNEIVYEFTDVMSVVYVKFNEVNAAIVRCISQLLDPTWRIRNCGCLDDAVAPYVGDNVAGELDTADVDAI